MFEKYTKFLFLIFILSISSNTWSLDTALYEKKLIEFKQKVCPVGTSETFDRLFRLYRGDSQFVPILKSGKLDRKTIEASLPIFQEKQAWIIEQKTKLKNLRKDQLLKKQLQLLQNDFLSMIRDLKVLKTNAEIIKHKKSGITLTKFKKSFDEFIDTASFLKSFHYPVNHFELRKEYDLFKNRNDNVAANTTYLFRKIVEDGAQNTDGGQFDLYHRANVDNLHWQLLKEDKLNEKLIYDLDDFFKVTKKTLSRSFDWQRERFNEWEKRNQKNINFYSKLLSDEKIPLELLSARSKALHELQNFSLEKMALTYEFWSQQEIEMQKIFVLETILFNEVGNTDTPNNLEKKDVARVVCRRDLNKKYNSLDDKEPLFDKLSKEDKALASIPGWPNVLFKYGEFSFTHFFMSGNKFLYCSDMSFVGKKLRNEILNILKNDPCLEMENFHALRYFSRAAMIGRVDMEDLWTEGYVAQLPNRGPELSRKVQKQIKKQNLYKISTIRTQDSGAYDLVAHISAGSLEYYLYRPQSEKFYTYRNPHFFRYFGPRAASKKAVYSEQ